MVAAIQSKLYYLVPRMAEIAREVGAQLTEPSYTLLIQAFGELGVVDEAIACLDRMEADGLRPNVVTYSALISVCKYRAEDVLALLKRMEKYAALVILSYLLCSVRLTLSFVFW